MLCVGALSNSVRYDARALIAMSVMVQVECSTNNSITTVTSQSWTDVILCCHCEMQARIHHIRVDPLEPNRVWFTSRCATLFTALAMCEHSTAFAIIWKLRTCAHKWW